MGMLTVQSLSLSHRKLITIIQFRWILDNRSSTIRICVYFQFCHTIESKSETIIFLSLSLSFFYCFGAPLTLVLALSLLLSHSYPFTHSPCSVKLYICYSRLIYWIHPATSNFLRCDAYP